VVRCPYSSLRYSERVARVQFPYYQGSSRPDPTRDDADEVFVVTFPAFQSEPLVSFIALVLVALHEIPSQDEVFGDVIDRRTDDTHGDIMPGHATVLQLVELISFPIVNTLKVQNTVVVEVLAGKDGVVHSRGVGVCQWMLFLVPTSVAQVQTTNESHCVVDD
jgi:hypothetical protein